MPIVTKSNLTRGPWRWRSTTLPGSRSDCGWLYHFRLGNVQGVRVGVVDQISHEDAALLKAAPDLLVAAKLLLDVLAMPEGVYFDMSIDNAIQGMANAIEAATNAENVQ